MNQSVQTGRTNDPERTRAEILEAATHEFAEKGLAGARVDVIAEATRTSKRMIYYYFGSKEGLYIAVLEAEYRRIRAAEAALHLEDLPPEEFETEACALVLRPELVARLGLQKGGGGLVAEAFDVERAAAGQVQGADGEVAQGGHHAGSGSGAGAGVVLAVDGVA